MRILKEYYKFIKNFNSFSATLKKDDFHKIDHFDHFYTDINFNISKKELSLGNTLIDDFLFKKIIDFLQFLTAKINFLLLYKRAFLKELVTKTEDLTAISTDIYNKQSDNAVAIIENKTILANSSAKLNFSYDLKNGFEVAGGKIYPNFKKIGKLEFNKTETYGKLSFKFKENVFLSSVNLVFSRNITSKVFVSYRKKLGTSFYYTSEEIKLSKVKTLGLNFDDCAELVISSSEPFNNYLVDAVCYGGTDKIEYSSGYGIVSLNSTETLKELLIVSNPALNFFYVNTKFFSDFRKANDFLDFENNENFKKLENNLNNVVKITEEDSIIFAFSTSEFEIEEFSFFGGS